jgi:DNA polymerase-3 subunit epsilon
MVFTAPETAQVFREVRKMFATTNAVFVAHNVKFDWGFVRNSLVRSDLPVPSVPLLCTYKLAKRLLTRNKKLNVGALAKYFDIPLRQRHRASGDAFATAKILSNLIEIARDKYQINTLQSLLQFQNKRMSSVKTVSSPLQKLQLQVRHVPHEPGVYFFRNSSEEILYIGKAKSLHDRVSSYFQTGAEHSEKIRELVRQVHTIEWQTTGTELSALLLESQQIKHHQPHYNTLIKRYRSYPFLRLTTQEDFPRIEWSYEIGDDNAEYFGPFNNRRSLESVVDIINRLFKLRKCTDSFSVSEHNSPCFYHQIKRCQAPCAAYQSQEEYAAEIAKVRDFLSGKSEGIVTQLQEEMYDLSETMQFEEAGLLRNRISELKKLFFRQQQIATSVNEHNMIMLLPATAKQNKVEVFFIRHGRLKYQRIVGKKVPFKELRKKIDAVYFDGSTAPKYCRKEEIDEIRIIANWLYRQRNIGKYIYISSMEPENILEALSESTYEILATV